MGRLFLPDTEIYLYSSSPVKALVAKAKIKKVIKLNKNTTNYDIKKIIKYACVTVEEFDEYFMGKDLCFLIYIKDILCFERSISIREMRDCGIEPPQSFRYIDNSIQESMDKMGFGI